VLASLRRAWPEAVIEWVVQDYFSAAVEAHPDLNGVLPFPRARFGHWWQSPSRAREMLKWFNDLRQRRFDLVIDCQGLGRSGLISWMSRSPRRVGLRSAREFGWLGYNQRIVVPHSAGHTIHTVDEMMMLIEALGIAPVLDMRLFVSHANRQWWTEQRSALGLGDRPYAVLAPCSRWPSKNWPIDRFAKIIEPLVFRGFEHVVVIGSPAESRQVQPLAAINEKFRKAVVVDLAGKTTIGQSMAVIAEAGVLIACDSAPLHMAVGFGRRCVGLFGPTDPARVGPYRMDHAVVRGVRPGATPNAVSLDHKDPMSGDSLMRLISHTAVLECLDRVLSMAPPAVNHSAPPSHDPSLTECAGEAQSLAGRRAR
jgi:ADP-heptose:LPS heptosyltransferase